MILEKRLRSRHFDTHITRHAQQQCVALWIAGLMEEHSAGPEWGIVMRGLVPVSGVLAHRFGPAWLLVMHGFVPRSNNKAQLCAGMSYDNAQLWAEVRKRYGLCRHGW